VPKKRKRSLTPKMIKQINDVIDASEDVDVIRENVLGYISVLNDGKHRLTAYVDAVKYCSYKLMGNTDIAAYVKTFPERYQRYIDRDIEEKHIAGVVSIYNGGVLVNKIMQQSMVPHYILNADMYQRALNVQAELMIGAKSETVRSNAADSILQHLRVPEAIEIDVNIGIKEDDSIKELRDTTLQLVAQQKMMIKAGAMSVKEIAHSKVVKDDIIDVEAIED